MQQQQAFFLQNHWLLWNGRHFTDNDELASVLRSIRVHGKGQHNTIIFELA